MEKWIPHAGFLFPVRTAKYPRSVCNCLVSAATVNVKLELCQTFMRFSNIRT
jgi:hypothetical protein